MRTFIAAAAAILIWVIIVGGGIVLWTVGSPSMGLSADASFFASLVIGFLLGMIGTFASWVAFMAIDDAY